MSAESTIFIDETIHGFDRNPDIYRTALEYPFVSITLEVLILAALLIWATVGRFGTPKKIASEFKTGKAVLVDNAINMLEFGNHKPEILARYVEFTEKVIARKLKVPRNLTEDELVEWLDNFGRNHGVTLSFRTIKHRAMMLRSVGLTDSGSFLDKVHEKPLLIIAQNLEQWKQEILDGSGADKNT